MPKLEQFQKIQQQFTARVRDPNQACLPDIDQARMHVYETLVLNNIEDVLAHCFPVFISIVTEEQWQTLVRDFFQQTVTKNPIYYQLPEDFIEFLMSGHAILQQHPYLLELAHYEWIELMLDVASEQQSNLALQQQGDVMRDIPVMSSLAQVLSYHYPVHLISDQWQPDQQQPHFYLVFRNPDYQIEFILLNALTWQLLQLLQNNKKLNGTQLIEQLIEETQYPDHEQAMKFAKELLTSLQQQHVILGTMKQED